MYFAYADYNLFLWQTTWKRDTLYNCVQGRGSNGKRGVEAEARIGGAGLPGHPSTCSRGNEDDSSREHSHNCAWVWSAAEDGSLSPWGRKKRGTKRPGEVSDNLSQFTGPQFLHLRSWCWAVCSRKKKKSDGRKVLWLRKSLNNSL